MSKISKSKILKRPTGKGKNSSCTTLTRIMNVPFTMANVTSLTEVGYIVEDVENIILKLLKASWLQCRKTLKVFLMKYTKSNKKLIKNNNIKIENVSKDNNYFKKYLLPWLHSVHKQESFAHNKHFEDYSPTIIATSRVF